MIDVIDTFLSCRRQRTRGISRLSSWRSVKPRPLPFNRSLIFQNAKASADRWRVLDATLAPEIVEAAGDAELGAGADIAIEGFAVVADRFDDPRYPILGEAELFAEIAVGAEGALEFGLVGLGHVVDVVLGDAELFGIDHRKQRPLDDVEPLVVAMADHRAERLLGDHLGQHGVIGGGGAVQAVRLERHELDLGGVVESGSRDRAADIDVEPGPVTLVVRGRETRQALADATGERATVLDRLEGLRRRRLGRKAGSNGKGENQRYAFHADSLS